MSVLNDTGFPVRGKASEGWTTLKSGGARGGHALGSGWAVSSTPYTAAGVGRLCSSAAWHDAARQGSDRFTGRRALRATSHR